MSLYRGRFAPSPTGPLHFGSLFAAVISYLEARHHNGQWLIRIEDIDPLREKIGATSAILNTLQSHHLIPDEAATYQSSRKATYKEYLSTLMTKGAAYACPCSRKYLKEHHGKHLDNCQNRNPDIEKCAFKYRVVKDKYYSWLDTFQAEQYKTCQDDFVLKRKEGFYAYQLAVVCDDIEQGISHVVRGFDLIDSTPMQLAIYASLGVRPPTFAHFPVIMSPNGQKLSKQNLAPAINNHNALDNLLKIFSLLQLPLKHKPDNCQNALNEALECWNTQFLMGKSELTPDSGL